ncbi:MAG: TldD/PmbA family protein [Cyanobacteria bacterium J06621_8]
MNEELASLLQLTARRGIKEAEVYQVTSQSQPVFFEGNRLKQLETSQSMGTALRIWHNNRPGLAVAYGKIEPELLIDKAIALSELNQPETVSLTAPRQANYDLSGVSATTQELITLGEDAISQLREAYPEVICSAELEFEQETTTLINSQGLNCFCRESGLSCSLGAELVRGEDFLGIFDGIYTKEPLDLAPIIESIKQRLAWAQYNVATSQGAVPVLLTANAATLLWDTLAGALNGQAVEENSSPWSKQLHQLVSSECLSLSQQADFQPYDCPFDDEGVPTQNFNLITKGILNQFYCDRTTACKLNLEPSGNGFRPSLESYPSPSLVNLIVAPGDSSFDQLLQQLDNGIIVDQILGGGADLSGDFSVNLDLGYRVMGGKIQGRVKDTAIAGNVYNIVKQIVALGNDSLWNGSCRTPSVIVEGISVVG